jgi:hypothetical protein
VFETKLTTVVDGTVNNQQPLVAVPRLYKYKYPGRAIPSPIIRARTILTEGMRKARTRSTRSRCVYAKTELKFLSTTLEVIGQMPSFARGFNDRRA